MVSLNTKTSQTCWRTRTSTRLTSSGQLVALRIKPIHNKAGFCCAFIYLRILFPSTVIRVCVFCSDLTLKFPSSGVMRREKLSWIIKSQFCSDFHSFIQRFSAIKELQRVTNILEDQQKRTQIPHRINTQLNTLSVKSHAGKKRQA